MAEQVTNRSDLAQKVGIVAIIVAIVSLAFVLT